ncbi:TRAP transporter large permease [Roseovarius sp.]|uniref:TRAP transporter large permease n=1 Tax=Roseovarius sp. TaxID=1486281 RepID=UPI003D0B3B50
MGIELTTVVLLGGLFGLLLLGVPMAFALGASAVVAAFTGFGFGSIDLIVSRTYGLVSMYAFGAVPMFLLTASIIDRSGMAADMYDAFRIWFSRVRGGIAVVTLVAAIFMAATTGIIGGEIVLLGLVALPQMLRVGYDRSLAIGVICAGGSLGTMIPPSIVLVIYGLATNTSVGDLFLAAIFPGIMMAVIYLTYILARCAIDPNLAPSETLRPEETTVSAKLKATRHLVLPTLIGGSVLGSIYSGVASVTEAATLGAAVSLVGAAFRKELSWPMLRDALKQTLITSSALLWITIGAFALIGVYNLLGGIAFITDLFTDLPFSPYVIVLTMMLALVVLGLFMDWIGIALLTLPIFVPVVVELGFDPVWFGVLFCMNMQISYLSPPFGPAAFYLKSVAPPEIKLGHIYSALWPFIIMQALAIGLLMAFPQIALWLPGR